MLLVHDSAITSGGRDMWCDARHPSTPSLLRPGPFAAGPTKTVTYHTAPGRLSPRPRPGPEPAHRGFFGIKYLFHNIYDQPAGRVHSAQMIAPNPARAAAQEEAVGGGPAALRRGQKI
jgi:hypothetical protein